MTQDRGGIQRRRLLAGIATLGGATATAVAFGPAAAAAGGDLDPDADQPLSTVPESGTHVVLLGTGGGPVPFRSRAGICTAVVVDGFTYLVDLGHGAFDQLGKTSLSPDRIPAAFITHLHSDHLADAWTLLWLRFGGTNPLGMPLDVYGPGPAGGLPAKRAEGDVRVVNPDSPTPGTEEFYAKVVEASAYDLNVRMRDESWPDISEVLTAHDVLPPDEVGSGPENVDPDMEPFTVMEDDRVRVTATLVAHAPVYPSYGFRFDTAQGSVVVSGDTSRSENLIRLAQGTDVLVHEVIDLEALALNPDLSQQQIDHLTEAHTDVRTVGRIATDARAKKLVLSHLAPSAKVFSDERWRSQARVGYSGPVHVGNDLDVLSL